jgi:phosphoribosylamine---glycine ligase
MKVLVIGGGGREHALAWKLAQCERVHRSTWRPATAARRDPRCATCPHRPEALADFAEAEKVALTVVGPEAPLAAGVVDLSSARAACASSARRRPRRSSKAPRPSPRPSCSATASPPRVRHLHRRRGGARARRRHGAPIVIKADGLAAGKGVVVAMTLAEAHAAIDDMLVANTLGVQHNAGGARVVIEEFMAGEEASFIVMCDGKHVVPLATSQDHKRIGDGDTGPNTGGMGAYSPAPVVTPNVHARVMQRDHPAHHRRHGARRHALHRLPLRRPDDRRAGPAAHGGIQLPPGRPRGPGHPDAPEERPLRPADARHRRHARPGRAAMGPPRRAGRGDGRRRLPGRAAQGRRHHRPAEAGRPRTCRSSTPARAARRPALVTSGGRVLCVTALGDSVKLAQQRAYEACAASASTARSGAATSATAPSSIEAPRRKRPDHDDPDTAVRDYLLGLQSRIVAPRGRGRQALPQRRLARPPAAARRRRPVALVEDGGCSSAAAATSATSRARAAAFGHAAPARAGRRALRGHGRVAGDAPAQPLRAHGAHERALLSPARRRGRRRAGGGSAAAWT